MKEFFCFYFFLRARDVIHFIIVYPIGQDSAKYFTLSLRLYRDYVSDKFTYLNVSYFCPALERRIRLGGFKR